MEAALITCVIVLSVVIVCILVLLGILFYNQMLVTNEVNKRLLLITKESIDKERSTQEELQAALLELDRATQQQSQPGNGEDTTPTVPDDEPFNPHSASEDYREDWYLTKEWLYER